MRRDKIEEQEQDWRTEQDRIGEQEDRIECDKNWIPCHVMSRL